MKGLALILVYAILLSYASSAQQNECDYKVEIIANNSEFESKDFSWRMKATKIEGKPTNITGVAEIEDSKGDIIRKYRPWVNESISKQKTSSQYTPNLKDGVYKIISKIEVECDDTNKGNNADAKTIKINMKNKEMTNTINQSNSQNTFAEYKMNNHIKNETINPVVINQAIENKTLSKNESEKLMASEEDNVIQLRNNDYKKKEIKLTANVQKSENVYESSNEKSKGLIMIFLLALSILLNIILIWRR